MNYTLALYVFLVCWATATPQIPDDMLLDGKNIKTHGFSLSAEFEEDFWNEVINNNFIVEGKNVVTSTANSRGYYVKLEVKDGKLFVIEAKYETWDVKKETYYMVTFDIDKKPFPVFAGWFTGEINHYYGESLGYTHCKTQRTVYNFKKGVLVSTHEETIKPFEYRIYDAEKERQHDPFEIEIK